MDKHIAEQVIDITTYRSAGYSPRFLRCPNCKQSISKSWDRPEKCSECDQKLEWNK